MWIAHLTRTFDGNEGLICSLEDNSITEYFFALSLAVSPFFSLIKWLRYHSFHFSIVVVMSFSSTLNIFSGTDIFFRIQAYFFIIIFLSFFFGWCCYFYGYVNYKYGRIIRVSYVIQEYSVNWNVSFSCFLIIFSIVNRFSIYWTEIHSP